MKRFIYLMLIRFKFFLWHLELMIISKILRICEEGILFFGKTLKQLSIKFEDAFFELNKL